MNYLFWIFITFFNHLGEININTFFSYIKKKCINTSSFLYFKGSFVSILFQAKDLKKKKKIQTKEELNVITKTIKGLNVISPNFKKPVEICVFWMRPNKLTVRMLSITAPMIFHNSHKCHVDGWWGDRPGKTPKELSHPKTQIIKIKLQNQTKTKRNLKTQKSETDEREKIVITKLSLSFRVYYYHFKVSRLCPQILIPISLLLPHLHLHLRLLHLVLCFSFSIGRWLCSLLSLFKARFRSGTRFDRWERIFLVAEFLTF